jgi:hypothetical protein
LWIAWSTLLIGSCLALGLANMELLNRATQENQVIEWITVICLFAAACVAFISAVYAHRRGQPSPVTVFLATGFAWGFVRELEYFGNLLDRGRFYFSRNVFQPQSYLGVSFFENFRQLKGLSYDAHTLYWSHLGCTALGVVILVLLATYFVRHRTTARAELRAFVSAFHHRLFLLGVGLYICAELLGGTLHRLPRWGVRSFDGNLYHRIVEESLECWGAITFLLCAAALWQKVRIIRTQPRSASRETVAAEPCSFPHAETTARTS